MTVPSFAPLALFVYNRVEHLRHVIESLLRNESAIRCALYIFSDGPRNPEAAMQVENVRKFCRDIAGFEKVVLVERPSNLGLAASIISGVSDVVARHGSVIVLEDDIIVSPSFLQYMNDGLNLYRERDEVASIHGYVYPVPIQLPETFFIRGADCWGWATWERAWKVFEPDGTKLLRELADRKLLDEFNYDGAGPFTQMLEDQIAGRNNSWAIRWHAANVLANRYTLYPGRSLVSNIGLDGSGQHCVVSDIYGQSLSDTPVAVTAIPIEQSEVAWDAFKSFFAVKLRRSLPSRIRQYVRNKVGLSNVAR